MKVLYRSDGKICDQSLGANNRSNRSLFKKCLLCVFYFLHTGMYLKLFFKNVKS